MSAYADQLCGTASPHLCTSAMLWASSVAEAISIAHVSAACQQLLHLACGTIIHAAAAATASFVLDSCLMKSPQ